MGDDRAMWEQTEAALTESDHRAAASLDDPAPEPMRAESAEVLRIRWDTPRGRKVRAQVIRDLRFEQSAHLGEILHDFRGASEVPGFFDLRCIKLDGENLSLTRLERADLTGASLAKTGLVSASLAESRLVKTRLVGAALREANLSRADLTDANLTEANLERTTLVSAVLGRARCIGAVFREASLVGADLRGAMLVRAVFESADLGGARVEGAHALAGTFARATTQPLGLSSVNELVLGEPEPAPTIAVPRAAERRPETPRHEAPRSRTTTSLRLAAVASVAPRAEAPAATKTWDAALAALLLQRGRVSRITVVLDGLERVVFEA